MTEPTLPQIDGLVWPHATDSRFVTSSGIRWHVQQFGSGPAMLLIHGTGASTHSWEGLADLLTADFALTLVDLPGHGFTEPLARSDMGLPSMARHLGTLVTDMGVKPSVVVGHSAGAAVAIRMVLDRLIPRPALLVSINGALLPWNGLARLLFPPLARAMASGTLVSQFLAYRAAQPGAVARMIAGTGGAPPARSIAFYEHLLKRPSHIQSTLAMMAMWDLDGLERDLPMLDCPLELISCGEDTAVPADVAFAVRSKVASSAVRYVRRLGHLAHEEQPDEIARLIRAAWNRCPEASMGCLGPTAQRGAA